MSFPGFYLGTFSITTGADGAPLLRGTLVANVNTNEVSGHAVFSNTNSPPVTFASTLEGVEHTLGLGGVAQAFALRGQSSQQRLGASYISTLTITLPKVWGTEGTANYTVFNDTPNPEKYTNVPVTIQWVPSND